MAYPDCALALAFEGASLRRRRAGGWVPQGQALFDAPDINAALDRLRLRAEGPDPKAAPAVLLVLPTDQVFYHRLAPDEADTDGAMAVRGTLQGLTPYATDALRFAFERLPDGGIAFAAVALETLEEAESFAGAHGFDTRGVLAPAAPGVFDAPAWFGLSSLPAPQGWLPRPEFVAWAVAEGENVAATAPDPVRFASARAKAHDAAQLAPPVREDALPEILTADEEARIARLLHRPGWLARLRGRSLGALAAGGALAASVLAALLWLSPPPGGPGAPAPDVAQSTATRAEPEGDTGGDTGAPTSSDPADIASLPAPPPDAQIDERDLWTPERGLSRQAEMRGLDDLVQPSLDPPLGTDALALTLPEPDTRAPEFAGLIPPPGPDARFEIDDDGLVRPRQGGARTPEGFVVYEGRPPRLPPARPDTVEEAQAAAEVLAEITPPEAQDAAEADVAPRSRPEDLIAQFERRTLGGRTKSELASLRPVLRRPELAAAAAAARAMDSASVQVATAATPGAAGAKPVLRPQDQVASAQSRAVAAVAGASTASVTRTPPAETRDIETAYVQAAKPTSTSVAQEATESNRINLKDVNLLGTFGPSSAQRALVRLPSGRVINVKVGDRVDGGRVSAIAQGELRYTKSGRAHVLKMPRG